ERNKEILADARLAGYPPLVGEALLQLGRAEGRLGNPAKLREHLVAALLIAISNRHDELLAQTLNGLILPAYLGGRPEDASLWGEMAQAAIGRLGDRRELEAQRLYHLGLVESVARRPVQAIEYFEAALATEPEPSASRHGALLSNIGTGYLLLGRYEAATEPLLRGLDLLEQSYGPAHPFLATVLANLGGAEREQGRYDDALPYYRRSLEVLEGALGSDHPDLAHPLTSMAQTLIKADRAAEAIAPLERALSLRLDHPQGDPAELARSRFQLARALGATDRERSRAAELAEAARATYTQLGERSARDLAAVEAWLQQRGGST
ncbi:MAG: tetratricopeptide repeat protein, partial [Acidobacteriota bacterium]